MSQSVTKVEQVPRPASLWSLIAVVVLSLLLADAPVIGWLLAPINTFVTTLHELGHATACLLTGGSVSGLTIVSDNQGHGGLTMCHGGNPFIYIQTGYLGTALFGCFFISMARFPSLAKTVLALLGLLIAAASLFLMTGAIFNEGKILQGLGSLLWGLIIGAGLIWVGVKLPARLANLVLLFLGVQTALNALTDVGYLIKLSLGLYPNQSFTDATTMEALTHIPSWFWSLSWGALSIGLLGATLWWLYHPAFLRPKKSIA